MKTLVSTMAISILLANPVQAAQNHDHGDEKMQGNNASKKHDTASSGMKDMHRHMKKMKQAMVQIKGEKDPVIKKQLMKNHMAEMHKAMSMMKGEKMALDVKMKDKMSKEMMHDRMTMMDKKLGMMQEMMEQMMQHNEQSAQ
jgi:periplasmic protein CpxP/Spy